MDKVNTEHHCAACDKEFNVAADLDRHMNDKHTESECHMCNKSFRTKKQANEHICMEGELIPQVCEKPYCQKEFISSAALTDHMKRNHVGTERSVCPKCGEIGGTKFNIKKHIEGCGKDVFNDKNEKSKEVCYHWRRGHCNRGSICKFSHVGKQDNPRPEPHPTANAPCRNGPSCSYLAKGKCKFEHHKKNKHQGEQVPTRGRQARRTQPQREQCKFQGDCDRVPNCPFLHSVADFPQYNKAQGFKKTQRNGQTQFRS